MLSRWVCRGCGTIVGLSPLADRKTPECPGCSHGSMMPWHATATDVRNAAAVPEGLSAIHDMMRANGAPSVGE